MAGTLFIARSEWYICIHKAVDTSIHKAGTSKHKAVGTSIYKDGVKSNFSKHKHKQVVLQSNSTTVQQNNIANGQSQSIARLVEQLQS